MNVRTVTCVLVSMMLVASAIGQNALVRVTPETKSQEAALARLGIELKHGEAPGEIHAIATTEDLQRLRAAGIAHSLLISDLTEHYQARAAREGSLDDMGGFKTLSEIVAALDQIHTDHPMITTEKFSIGTSLEGNPIWCMKISDNPNVDEDELELMFNSLIHAREPAGMEALFYFFDYLTDNYSAGSGNEATELIDNREFYWVPCFNPDGYLYNELIQPDGGGMWRKNRRDNGDGSFGVDLNRNFEVNWGEDDIGSSPDPSNVLYRGPSPFSEPETQVYRSFFESREFILAMNYHTYSNLVLYPWGSETYLGGVTPDDSTFSLMADSMSVLIEEVNGAYYEPGTAWQVLYSVNGDANDWCYGEQETKRKIFAFTPEVGGASDGFWPLPSRILPLSQECLPANLFVSKYAEFLVPPDQYVQLLNAEFGELSGDGDEFLESGETGSLTASLKNIGYEMLSDVSGELTAISAFVTVVNGIVSFGSGDVGDTLNGASAFTFEIPGGIPGPFEIEFELRLTATSGLDTTIALSASVGPPVFAEDFESGAAGWTHEAAPGWNDEWHLSTALAYSGASSYKCGDTGGGEYSPDLDARLISPLIEDLPQNATCTFWSNMFGERSGLYPDSAYDGGVVEISVDGGAYMEITPAEGYTHTFRYVTGAFPYDGPMPGRECFSGTSDWRQYSLELAAYAGSDIRLRFRFGSDSAVNNEGWYVDDVIIRGANPVVLLPPEEVVVSSDGVDVTLCWRSDINAAYRILADDEPDGPFDTVVGMTSDTCYVLSGEASVYEKRFYQVVGVLDSE